MIQLTDVTLRRGPEVLLRGASATLYPGQKVGLVGANGSGKSSLFALLRDELHADAGEVLVPRDWTVAHMAQTFTDLERPALEFVLDGDGELRAAEKAIAEAEAAGDGEAIARAHARYENAGGYDARARAGGLLNGLGFASTAHDRPLGAFSGGWRVRLGLAQALMCPSDLLLLDEPTNHLDLEAVLWLEDWLKAYRGTLVLISHDRDFLDGVVEHILHVEHQRLNAYTGGYSDFERQRAEQLARQQATFERQQRAIAHMQRFVDRFRYKATKAKAAQSRIKAMERMELEAPAHVDSPFRFEFRDPPQAAAPLVQLEGVSLGYGDTPVLENIALSLGPGDRVGLLGPNGAGKSTLVRALAGELVPRAGSIHRSPKLHIGYFAQHQLEQLDTQASPLIHLQRQSPNTAEQTLRDFLGGFGFSGHVATGPVAPLSGGEKARLVLALLVWQAPNLLLLDEPTNHLDLEMRHALTVALQGYEGAVVTVSHDRHLLNTTVDRYLLAAGGEVAAFDGDLNDYRCWLRDQGVEAKAAGRASVTDAKRARRAAAARRERLRPLRQRAEQLLHEVEALGLRLAEIEAALTDPALYEPDNQPRLNELLREQGQLRKALETREAEWMAAEETLEGERARL